MIYKSDTRGQMGLKMSVHAFVIVLYRCANFHQNRRGVGYENTIFCPISRGMTLLLILGMSYIHCGEAAESLQW